MSAEYQKFKKATNEAEKFKALVHSIPEVAVSFESHTKNVYILSPMSMSRIIACKCHWWLSQKLIGKQ